MAEQQLLGTLSEADYDKRDPWYVFTEAPKSRKRGVHTSDNPTVEVFLDDGRSFTLGKGDRLRSGHPLVKGRPDLFEKA